MDYPEFFWLKQLKKVLHRRYKGAVKHIDSPIHLIQIDVCKEWPGGCWLTVMVPVDVIGILATGVSKR